MNDAIRQDGNEWFGIIFGLMFFKGILASLAGPAPNYDMQRVLSCKNPREASMMSAWVNVVLTFPRYFLITGLTVLALVFFSDQIRGMGTNMDFERVLPEALGRFVPAGLLGFLIAGLLAAYMSTSPLRSMPHRRTSLTIYISGTSTPAPIRRPTCGSAISVLLWSSC